jgi:uncharacterized protein DUF4154
VSKRRCVSSISPRAGVGGGARQMRMPGSARAVAALLFALVTFGDAAFAQAPANEAQVKAAFVYNFLKFVDWPADVFVGPGDSLIVGIVGSGATADAAASFLDGKPVNGRAVAIRRFKDDGPRPGVHALFIGNAETMHARHILDDVANAAVLSIGESTDFAAEGGVIGLLVEAQKVRFEINTDAAATAGLKISSKLLALARIVRSRETEHHKP